MPVPAVERWSAPGAPWFASTPKANLQTQALQTAKKTSTTEQPRRKKRFPPVNFTSNVLPVEGSEFSISVAGCRKPN
jgi:hypothetical protein